MRFRGKRKRESRTRTLLATVAVVWVASCGAAFAAAPDLLLRMPGGQTTVGEGAGEFNNPRGLAADPVTGRVFVADRWNSRVSEYTAWGLFVKSWGWGVADGSLELQQCGPAEPEEDPEPSLCRKGIPGDGEGQLAASLEGGMAVDDEGNVWVGDLENFRVQKFTAEGEFLLMFGGDVNSTKVDEGAPVADRNVCPVDPSDVCQAGVPGEGPSQLASTFGDYIAYRALDDSILVGDKDGIQMFDLEGAYLGEIAFDGLLAAFAGQSVNALDVDENGNVYFSVAGVDDIYKLSSAGLPLSPGKPGESAFDVQEPLGVAVDEEGNVYGIQIGSPPFIGQFVLGFDVTGAPIEGMGPADRFGAVETDAFPEFETTFSNDVASIGANQCAGSAGPNLYVTRNNQLFESHRSYASVYGSPPIGCEPPPQRPPLIVSQFASQVSREGATLKAQINPRFWTDTTYFVEYGTGKCSEGLCDSKLPLTPALLTSQVVNSPITTSGIGLESLEPGTTYHFRFVAESGGGGPVFGLDPDGKGEVQGPTFEEGLEATFTTFLPEGPSPACPNDSLRAGFSADLPDCRAYEMVSPLDKGNGDVALWMGRSGSYPRYFELNQSADHSQSFTFTSALAFGDPESAPFVSQYLSERNSTGWESEPISPPRTESPVRATSTFDNEFKGFSADLCQAWVRNYSVAPLAPGAVEKYQNLYRRENCVPPPAYEALTTVTPKVPAKDFTVLTLAGFSEDGRHTIFMAGDKLHPDAPSLGPADRVLYERAPDGLRYVCYLPKGKPSPLPCAAGTLAGPSGHDLSSLRNAISADGSRIFWTAYSGTVPSAAGQIYVRIDGKETRKVSGEVTPEPAFFWTAANDGSKAIFEIAAGPLKGNLYELDVDTGTPTLIAGGVEGPMGASEDASRIYFSSIKDLDDDGPAAAGGHNLYLYEADPGGGSKITFIMALAGRDIGSLEASSGWLPTRPVDRWPSTRAARVSGDGLHAAFMSVASPTPTGYDNRDANSDQPDAEVYLYDAAEEELRCVSCNPTGARPVGEDQNPRGVWAAAQLQGWEFAFRAPRVLSEDGTRVFFESFDALAPEDTNSTWDVYQWEEPGKGTCTTESDSYSEVSGGCVDLLSAGTGPAASTFFDADPSGSSVFFSSRENLVDADYGLNDVYVARVGGGFAKRVAPMPCDGDACQLPPPPAPDVTPPTEKSAGSGNVAITPKPRRCPKGKRKVRRGGKVKCVKRKKKGGARRARR